VFFDRGIPTVTQWPPLSIDERIDGANRNVAQISTLSFGTRTLFLSFNDSISLTTMQNALDSVSDTGNIVVEAVYVLNANNEVDVITPEVARASRPERVIGAKVDAPVTLISVLRQQSEVALVELATADLNEETFVPLAAVTGSDRNPSSDSAASPNEPTDIISLETFVNFNISGVVRADFIDDYRFTAITADSVLLCEIYHDDETDELKIRIVSESDLDGELLFTFFTPCDYAESQLIMRVRNENNNTIYHMGGADFALATIVSSSDDLTVLAVTEDYVFYAVNRSVIYRYDTATGVIHEVADFQRSVAFERNGDLSCFVINLGESARARVYDARSGMMHLSDDVPASLLFYRNSTNVLTDGENFFTVTLDTISDPDTVLRFAERRGVSDLFTVFEVTEQSVRILLR
jgi:hypothetical protein